MHRLFYAAGSPYARMVRVAVAELGLGDRIAEVETTLRDPASTLLPLNPVGRVPTLVLPDGATVLTETTLILPYLDRVSGRPPLLPMGDEGLRVLSDYGRVTGLLDGIAVWNRELRPPEHERSPGVIALEAARADRDAVAMEREAAGGAGPAAGPGIVAARIDRACAPGYSERRQPAWRR